MVYSILFNLLGDDLSSLGLKFVQKMMPCRCVGKLSFIKNFYKIKKAPIRSFHYFIRVRLRPLPLLRFVLIAQALPVVF